jgi:hypothetical protein
MAHEDHHHEVKPNPDYDGPKQHCLPPDVHEGIGKGFYFVVLMAALILFAAWLGTHLL